ncbi:MAG TPA: recombinase zinc beta ribbon domain-containing protein, partial [Pseudobdellovibrionaceae bacterium]|nr:recombinase zinc beta ribbon domain-containing protein [Pseudobdellovibrionaceae bacterium]
KASWKPLVDLEVFNLVQEKLAANKHKFKPDEWKTYPYPMTELLVCGECGKHLGGKSAHGKTRKHFYYGHPRQLNSDGVSHLKRCRLERIRAERIEGIAIRSLKEILSKPGLLDHWLEIYAKNSSSEIPALEGRLKTIDSDVQTNETRVKNLVMRISDLPPEVSADAFFGQIKELNSKIAALKLSREELLSRSHVLKGQMIDKEALKAKLARAIESLERTPVERRKPIYANLIKFAELHPTKIRMAVYAPTRGVEPSLPENQKATGTDGLGGFSLNSQKSSQISDCEPGKILSLVTRGSSTSVTFGAPRGT